MTDPINKSNGASGPASRPKTVPPAAPKAADQKFANDSFMRTPPTAEQLAAMRGAIAALDDLPPVPRGAAAKKAWVEQARPAYEAADKALDGMREARFFQKAVPDAEVDAAGPKVYAFGEKLRDAEEGAGLRAPEKPLSPGRPLYGRTKAVEGWMKGSSVGAIVGLFAWPLMAVVDTADAVTRPVQALMYPAELAKYKLREAEYEKAKGQ